MISVLSAKALMNSDRYRYIYIIKLATKLVNGFFETVYFTMVQLLNAKGKDETLLRWELLLGSFNIIVAFKHWFIVDLGQENLPSSLLSTREVTNYILYPIFLVVSPSLAEGPCDISRFGFSVCSMSVCVMCYLSVHQQGVCALFVRRHVSWKGLTRRVLCRRFLQERSRSVSVPLSESDAVPCIFLMATLQGQQRQLGENIWKSAEQLGEWTQVVRPPKSLEQHRFWQLQPQSQACHDQDGEFWGHHGADQGWQHIQ